jgi:regulator of replication initiation timing
MRKELNLLEEKITQLVQLNTRLRVENHHLRQELAEALNHTHAEQQNSSAHSGGTPQENTP